MRPAEPKEVGFLFSYHYCKNTDLVELISEMNFKPRVFIDSGGFSAFTQGLQIDVNSYAEWLLRNRKAIDVYANLDSIGDPKETLRNQIKLEQKGLRPLPVIHVGSDVSLIRSYAERGYSYQCLGGMVPHLSSAAQAIRSGGEHDLLHWLDRAHEVALDAGVGLHGFGATTWSIVQRYPWKSVDSSSWAAGYRFGNMILFQPRSGRWLNIQTRDVQKVMPLADLVRGYGCDPMSIVRDTPDSRNNLISLAALSWLEAQRWLHSKGHQVDCYLAEGGNKRNIKSVAFALSNGAEQ